MRMKMSGLHTVLASLVLLTEANNPFCDVESCDPGSHTLCQFTLDTPSDACGTVIRSGLTDDERDVILNFHNAVRERAHNGRETRGIFGGQPAAMEYVSLEWSYDLEFSAQRWANQCINNKDDCRDMHDYLVGQSIEEVDADSLENVEDIDFPIWEWYDEVDDFFSGGIQRYESEIGAWNVTNEYTQMIWGNTIKIGCGAIRFSVNTELKLFFVCNYGPRGNIDNEPVYEVQQCSIEEAFK